MRSLAATLDALRPHLPVALVSAAAFDRARAAVDHLEPEITNGTYFECRLQSGTPRVDLVVIVGLDGGRRLAATGGRRSAGARHEPPGWGSLLALCRQWTASDPALRDLIDHIWLEYDVEGEPSRHAAVPTAPGVFCSLRRAHRRACSAPGLCRKVLSALEALTGRSAPYSVRECLSDCCARLPLESGMPHVGFMAGRKAPAVRVCIAKLPAADAAHFLAATAGIGGGTVAEIVRLASLPDSPGGPLYVPMLHLDIDERHGFVARVGMERQFPWICQLAGRLGAGEHTLLDALTARGLCTRDKRDALLEWPGRSVAIMPHEIWWSVVERRVNHVKFVYEPESGVEAKGYLFARHRACRRRPPAVRLRGPERVMPEKTAELETTLIAVDIGDRETGRVEKMTAHRHGILHRAFSIFVFDDADRLLLQRRARGKYHSGGLWSNTCCSHPRAGEPLLAAAHRRLQEEMGFDCPLEPVFGFVYRATLDGGLVEHEYDHVIAGRYQGAPTPDVREVEGWKWERVPTIRSQLALHREAFTAWFERALDGLLSRGLPASRVPTRGPDRGETP